MSSSDMFAQQKAKVFGTIKNVRGGTISHAGISLKNNRGYVLAFGQSDERGNYTLSLPDTPAVNRLLLEVHVIGYQKALAQLEANKLIYNFILEEKPIDLKEVEIKRKPLVISIGDTLSYDVAFFSRLEDRSIGDVIRRLPGITIAENGQISYNGKSISNLFIHGDDLMDGRYGLATRVISKEMIKSIDVIQNHQPVKVLKNKVFTDDVAMNLVLKDENKMKLGGQAMLGGGLPKQFDVAFSGMIFNKAFKMLNSLQANNSGVDYWNDIEQLGTVLGAGNGGNAMPKPLLYASTVGNPDLPKPNYYINKSGTINTNNLYNLRSGLQLKANVQLLLDKNTMHYSSSFVNYLSNSNTVNYYEQQYNLNKPYRLNVALTAMQNKQRYFLNNKLSVNLAGNDRNGHLDFNRNVFNQYLDDNSRQFSNDFTYTPALKNRDIIDFRWYMSYFENPQTLNLDTGLNADVLNNGIAYSSLRQYAKIPSFLNNVTISYRVLNKGAIKHNYQFGMVNDRQQLNSELLLTQSNEIINTYLGDVGNKLHWRRDRFFVNAEYSIKKETWDATLSLPVNLQSLKYWQSEYVLDEVKRQFLVNPIANVRVYFNAEDFLRLSYNYQNQIGDISSVYRGAILVNYRNIMTNDVALQQRNVQSASLYYNFQRSIILLFINATLSHKRVDANNILSSIIDKDIQRTVLLPLKNRQDMLSTGVGISKYIFALATTVKLRGSWNQVRYDQLVNQVRLPFNNYSQSLSLSLDSKFFNVITLDYQGVAAWNKSSPLDNKSIDLVNKSRRIEQSLNLGYSSISNLNLNVEVKNIYSTQTTIKDLNYLFLNARLRYKLTKLRTDISFDMTNIMNEKRYEVLYVSSNQFAINSYGLRGRMGILRLTFLL